MPRKKKLSLLDEPEVIHHTGLDAWLLTVANDPYKFVCECFPWGDPHTDLAGHTGPDAWQAEVLCEIRDALALGAGVDDVIREAVGSGHGVGKSCLVAWLILWAISTREDTRGVVTANTEIQLRTKTWPETAKWYRLSRVRDLFDYTATAIFSSNKEHEKTWRVDAITWSENRTEAFAGMHNQGKRLILIMDEASSIPAVIWETCEGALTDKNTQIIWCVFGNPTRNVGRFKECFGRFRHRWKTHQVDSRKAKMTNKSQIAKWADDYGEDSDFFRVRVKGEFPRVSSMQFIGTDVVEAAKLRIPDPAFPLTDALVMGVDVARFGDDMSVISFRRGPDARSIPWVKLRNTDTMALVARIAHCAQEFHPQIIFVDGGGVGGGVVDRLRELRFPVHEVQFGGAADYGVPNTDGRVAYANKRAEIWGALRDWLRHGIIPDDRDLEQDLLGVEYGYTMKEGRDAILLEKKDDMKSRGLASPDAGDSLATTFAMPVGSMAVPHHQPNQHKYDYNPMQSAYDVVKNPSGSNQPRQGWMPGVSR